jgi:Tfp pilus assembly protein PilE
MNKGFTVVEIVIVLIIIILLAAIIIPSFNKAHKRYNEQQKNAMVENPIENQEPVDNNFKIENKNFKIEFEEYENSFRTYQIITVINLQSGKTNIIVDGYRWAVKIQ